MGTICDKTKKHSRSLGIFYKKFHSLFWKCWWFYTFVREKSNTKISLLPWRIIFELLSKSSAGQKYVFFIISSIKRDKKITLLAVNGFFLNPTKKKLVYVTAFHLKKIVKHEPNSHKSITFTVNNTNLRTSICVTDPNRINSTETQKLSMKQYKKCTCFPKNLKKLIKNNKTGVIFINKSDVHMMKSFLCKKLFESRKFILYSDQQNWDLKYNKLWILRGLFWEKIRKLRLTHLCYSQLLYSTVCTYL